MTSTHILGPLFHSLSTAISHSLTDKNPSTPVLACIQFFLTRIKNSNIIDKDHFFGPWFNPHYTTVYSVFFFLRICTLTLALYMIVVCIVEEEKLSLLVITAIISQN